MEIGLRRARLQEEARQRYWLALGRFVDRFSETELFLFFLLRNLTRVGEYVAAAIFSGTRVDAALSFATRIVEARNLPTAVKEELAYVRAQLGIINRTRNDLLHYGGEIWGVDRIRIANYKAAHTEASVRRQILPQSALDDMTEDLAKIIQHLLRVACWDRPGMQIAEGADAETLNASWRYKPPEPDPPPQRRPRKRSTPQRPLGSSPG